MNVFDLNHQLPFWMALENHRLGDQKGYGRKN
jgi:hypothetical protein